MARRNIGQGVQGIKTFAPGARRGIEVLCASAFTRYLPAMLAIRPEAGYGRFLVSQLSNPDSLVMVAENFGTVVGYVLADVEPTNWMELRGPCGVVQDVYVDEAARRLGAGRLLMRAAIAWVRSKGRSQVVLLTKTRNEHAQQWKKASSAKLPDATALLAATQRIG